MSVNLCAGKSSTVRARIATPKYHQFIGSDTGSEFFHYLRTSMEEMFERLVLSQGFHISRPEWVRNVAVVFVMEKNSINTWWQRKLWDEFSERSSS